MATEESVTEQLKLLGIDIKKEVLDKCVSLCEEYDVDAENFVEQWVAFSLNNLNGVSPDLTNLDLFERKEFSKRAISKVNAPAKECTPSNTGTALTVYGRTITAQSDNEVLSDYMSIESKKVKKEEEEKSISTHQNEICPVSYSPNVTHSAKYASRSNAGSVVFSYGDEKLLQIIGKANGPNDMMNFNIAQMPNEDDVLYTKALFGLELLQEKASIFYNHIGYISQYIMKKAGITETTSVRQKREMETVVAGRIECDADVRLNPKSVVLQGTWDESLSLAVPVDLDNVKQYSLFPGQVVVMRGTNPQGDKFLAHEVICDASLPIPDHMADTITIIKGTVSLIVAAGPYTTSDNLAYEPLKDLISYINTYKPHVVIMTGPFLDSEHSKVKDISMAEAFKPCFDKLINILGELNTTSPFTKVFIQSSSKEAFHSNIYPTPPYSSRRKHHNIFFVPDPCTLNINGVVVGVTGTDVLMHISQEEISSGMGGDKLSRLAGHVLSQQCYWPVWGAGGAGGAVGAGAAPCVDAALWAAHAQLPCTPHILLLPSSFRYFVKEVNGCVVLNPERLTKGSSGGTFSRLLISNENTNSLDIAAQIVRI